MNSIIEQVKAYLTDKYDCHTLILYGSYAEGDFSSDSDLDVIGFSDNEDDLNDTTMIGGVQLDAWIKGTSQLDMPQAYIHTLNSIILLDERGLGHNFTTEIIKIFEKGTDPISTNQREFLKAWLVKMQRRTLRSDAEGLYRYHWMLKDSLEIYFELKNLWFLGVKKSLKWLEKNEPEVFVMFEDSFRGEVGCNESKKLINYLVQM